MGLYKSLLTITEKRKDKNQDKDMVQIRNLLKVGVAPGQWSPTFLAPATDFHGRQLSHKLGGRDGLKMVQAHSTLCTLFLLLLHQLYLRS